MKKKKGLIIALAIVAAIVLVAFVAINATGNSETKDAKFVKTSNVEINEIKTTILTSGRIQPRTKTTIAPEIAGKVDRVEVKVGDKVKKGDELVRLNTDQIENQIEIQELRLKAAEVNLEKIESMKKNSSGTASATDRILYEDAKKSYDQKKALYDAGVISKSELDAAKTTLDRTYNSYKSSSFNANSNYDVISQTLDIEISSINLEDLENQLDKSRILAEKDGVVTELKVKENDFLAATAPIGLVEDTENLKMVVNINEFDIKDVEVGQKVTITAEGNNKQYEGEIVEVAPKAEMRSTGQSYETVVEVTIDIKSPDGLKINFTANAEIHVREAKDAITVSYDALALRDGKNVVFKVQDGVAKLIPVEMGMQGDIYVEVISEAIKEGDKVVLNPSEKLMDGDLVKEGL